MDPRRNYPQDPEPRWYQDDRGYPSEDRGYPAEDRGYPADDRGYGDEQTDWERRGEARHADSYRVPEPRGNPVSRPYVDGYDGYQEPSSHAAPEPLAPPARIGGDRPGSDRSGDDRLGSDRPGNDRLGGDRFGADRLGSSTGEMSLDEALGGRPATSHATEAMDRSQLRRNPPPAGATSGAPFGANPFPVTPGPTSSTNSFGPPSSTNTFGGQSTTGTFGTPATTGTFGGPPTTGTFGTPAGGPSVAAPTTAVPTLPPPPGGAGPKAPELGRGVYRSRRPALAAALVALTVLFELPALRIFATAALASKVDAAGTIASIFLILGLPMFAMGLYGLITGAAAAAAGSRTWLRTPLAYLPVAVILFLAAALAA